MMFRAYQDAYEATPEDGGGPNIPEEQNTYKIAEENVVATVLKDAGTNGITYDEDEKRAFFWYRYLFLGRGKPSTHIVALSRLTDQEVKAGTPDVLQRFITHIKNALPDGN